MCRSINKGEASDRNRPYHFGNEALQHLTSISEIVVVVLNTIATSNPSQLFGCHSPSFCHKRYLNESAICFFNHFGTFI